MAYRVQDAIAVGATKVRIGAIPNISANTGCWVIVDAYTVEAELRHVVGIAGATLTVDRPFAYAHAVGDSVFIQSESVAHLIPWSWWGGQPKGGVAAASQNVLGFNRLQQELYKAHRSGVFVDPGTFYVNDELRMERDSVLEGVSPNQSIIEAVAGFPFQADGEKAVIHPYRDGAPVLYNAPGPSGRWFIRNLLVSGKNLPNSCGILSSPQQPDHMENVRIGNCAGAYGLALVDVQDVKVTNLEVMNCYRALHLRSCRQYRFYGLDIEQNTGPVTALLEGAPWGSFYGIHHERGVEEVVFECITTTPEFGGFGTDNIALYDAYSSNGTTGSFLRINGRNAVITNMRCNRDSATYLMVDDGVAPRGIKINSMADTQRWIGLGVMDATGGLFRTAASNFSYKSGKRVTSAEVLRGAVNWAPGAIPAGALISKTVDVPGSLKEHIAGASFETISNPGLLLSASVTAPGVVTVSVYNTSGASQNPGQGWLRVSVQVA